MPERIKSLLDKYSMSRISDTLRNRKRQKILDSVTKEVVESGRVDGRASGIGNMDYPIVPMEKEIMDFTPVGDAMQAIRAAGDAMNGNLGKAVLGAGMLFIPNSIEKAAKPVVQSFKSGATRTLRHAPARTIEYEDALSRPYRGQNFIHHDIPGEYVRGVLNGETRLMSPSLAVNRWGDYNDIYTPGFYGDHVLIGDKSILDNSRLFNGDGMTPTVSEVWYGMDSVPSDMREKVSEDIWRRMENENIGKNIITDVNDLDRLDLPFSDQYFEAKYHGTYPIENFRYGIFPEPRSISEEKVIEEFGRRGLPIETYKAVGGNEGYNNKVETMLKVLNENQGLLFNCGGKKYPEGGKFFRTNLQNESPMMYQPMMPINYPIEAPLRFRPQPDLGDYRAPSSTGMMVNYPISLPERVPASVQEPISAPVVVEVPAENLFSDEAVARRALKQRYAESAFNDKAKSHAGAQGAWQIMPITLKDYLGRGRGKSGDLNDPVYNRKVRDWVMGIIPRDLQEFWSEDDSDRAKLAKLYAAYNWGAGNLRSFLRKKRDAGVDISNPDNWVDDLNPETRRYVKYLAFDEDIPDSTVYTNAAFEKAAVERGYASGGRIHIKPENRGKFTALLKRTGKSASWFKEHGTPLQRKRATFALNARKWKHGDGGPLDNYFYDGGPYGVIPLGGDYLTYLQTIPEVSGGVIDPAVVTAALPAKFNGSQEAAARYAEGYLKGAKPVSEAMSRAGQDIFNTVDTVVGLTPTPAGALTWLGHMGKDAVEGEWGKVGRDALIATALGAGARGIGWLKNYVDDATNFGEDIFRAFTDRVPGRVSTNFTYSAPATRATMEAVPTVSKAVSAPYEIENLGGGYMLKSLMRGNPLEKQINKNGTVNVNNVRALIGKGGKVEQAVVDKVLASKEFAGRKSIDYNKFRKAVQDELITYDRTPDTRWSDYGMGRIGQGMDGSPNARKAVLDAKTHMDRFNAIDVYGTPAERSSVRNLTFDLREGKISESDYDEKFNSIYNAFSDRIVGNSTPETFVFSSSRIPSGSAKHYNPNTLGHSRTYTSTDEPDVLHVMESQSDWGQGYKKMNLDGEYNQKRINSLERRINNLKESIDSEMEGLRTEKMNDGSDMSPWFADSLRKQIEKDKQLLEELTVELDMRRNPKSATQQDYLAENFTSRQIQENLRYAAEKGQTKMRYPTRETAAKIEGYPKREAYFDAEGNDITTSGKKLFTYGDKVDAEIENLQRERARLTSTENWGLNADTNARVAEINRRLVEIAKTHEAQPMPGITKKITFDYENILKKYSEFPRQYKKLYKNADVRTVTDSKGNTWYEVDVPEGYLQQEWAYEEGGSLILPKMMMDKHSPDKLRKAIANIRARRMK